MSTSIEELEEKLDAFIARSDEIRAENLRRSYDEFKRKLGGGGTVPPVVEPTIKAKEKGISGILAFKITSIKPEDAVRAIDGKKSTSYEGKSITADIGGIGDIKGIAIKFKGGPYDYKVDSSFDGTIWAEVPVLATTFKKNEFDVFEFSAGILARYIKLTAKKGSFNVTTLELLGEIKKPPEIPVPEPEPPKPDQPPSPPPTGALDEFGIKLLATPKPGGKNITDMSYKFSEHNTGTRDTFSKKGADFMSMLVSGYYKISLSDNSEELSYKVFGGTHSDGVAKQGQCYSFGCQQDGAPSLKKEYPEHPTTPDFSKKAKIEPGMPSKLKSLKNRWIGLAGVIWADQADKKVHIKVYVDDDGMVDGKPANNWKLWWTFTDDGSTMKGPAFMENMGVKHGGDALFYMRIDTVTKKTDTYGISCREITVPNQ
jgi:hypothetical protein